MSTSPPYAPVFVVPGDEVCAAPNPAGGKTCERPARHDVHLRRASGGADGWLLDATSVRAAVAEEIAAVLDRCAIQADSVEQVFTADAYRAAAALARQHATADGEVPDGD